MKIDRLISILVVLLRRKRVQAKELAGVEINFEIKSPVMERDVAQYFKEHPEEYQKSLDYGAQITAIGELAPDSPEIEDLARNYGGFIKSLPFYAAFNQLINCILGNF